MNKLVMQYYHRNTNHGGSKGNSNGAMERGDHMGPIMKLFQRRYMWLLGYGRPFFEDEPKIDEWEREIEEEEEEYVI